MTRVRTNPHVYLVPHGQGVVVRAATSSRSLPATPFQAGLLRFFAEPATIDEVLARNPFAKDEARRFLQDACSHGLLLPVTDDGGDADLPAMLEPHRTFCGAPLWQDDPSAGIVVVGAPLDHDTTGRPGARFGPAAVRAATEGARYRLDPLTLQPAGFVDYGTGETLLRGVRLADAGDVPVVPGASSAVARGRLTDAVMAVLKRGALPFVVGGDHSITRAVLAAYDEPIHVVHLDAHTDLGDASPSLPLHHGNVMTYVVEQLTWVQGVHQIGLRGVCDRLGHVEHPKVRQLGIDALRAHGVDAFLDGVPQDAACYLSVDIDVVDPAFAPATGTPVPGGLFPHELKALVRLLAQRRTFVGMDLVEVSEPVSAADGTAALGVACILSFAQGIVERMGRDDDGGAP